MALFAGLALAPLAALVVSLGPLARSGTRALAIAVAAAPAAALAGRLGPQALATTLAALVAAALGYALAGLLETPAQLAAIAAIALVVDAVSVAAGPTRAALDHAPGALDAVSLHLPAWGGDGTLLVGPVDVLFLAVFAGGAARVGLRAGPTAVAVTLGLVASAALAAALDRALPALPLMALGFWAANAGRLRRRPAAPG